MIKLINIEKEQVRYFLLYLPFKNDFQQVILI